MMPLPPYFEYRDGHLFVEQCQLADVAKRYGTPVYVYSYHAIADQFNRYKRYLDEKRHGLGYHISYAVKANSNLSILNQLHQLGSNFDIVSAGELKRVIKAGANASDCTFSGVGKTDDEIRYALEKDIGYINIESVAELNNVARIAQSMGVQAPVAIRVNPNVDADTHPYISTGLKENKFGIHHDDVLNVFRQADNDPSINLLGIACHIGSQITELSPFRDCIHVLLDLVHDLEKAGISLSHINIGGGLGVIYKDETPPSINDYIETITGALNERECTLQLHIEPGRCVVANAGVLVSQVIYIKSQAQKNFAIVDAAMNDILRPMLYQGWHRVESLVEDDGQPQQLYDVVGPVCESTDTIASQRLLSLNAGDYVAIFSAGAYCMSMSSNYNSRPRPAEILIKGEKTAVIRTRDTMDDVCLNEQVVDL